MKIMNVIAVIIIAGSAYSIYQKVASVPPAVKESTPTPAPVATKPEATLELHPGSLPPQTRFAKEELSVARGVVTARWDNGFTMACTNAEREAAVTVGHSFSSGKEASETFLKVMDRSELENYGPVLQMQNGKPQAQGEQPARYVEGEIFVTGFPLDTIAPGQHLRIVVGRSGPVQMHGRWVENYTATFEMAGPPPPGRGAWMYQKAGTLDQKPSR